MVAESPSETRKEEDLVTIKKKTPKAALPKEEPVDGRTMWLNITPDMCRQWLENAEKHKEEIGYRPVRPARLRRYTKEMAEDRWIVTGESMIWAPVIPGTRPPIMEQVSVNGMNRLHAGLEAGVPFRSLCVFDMPAWTRRAMDTGGVRMAAHVLSMYCHDQRGAAHAAILQMVSNALLGHYEKLGHDEVIEMYSKTYAKGIAFVDSVTRAMGKKFSRTPVLAAIALAYRSKPDAVSEFVEHYINGDLRETDPEMLLRKYVEFRAPVERDRRGQMLKALQAMHSRIIGHRPKCLGGGEDGLDFFRPKAGK
jgi:hypothetical protein